MKAVCTEIEKVKSRIGHGKYWKQVKIDKDHFIDEEDKAFISENYMDPTSTNLKSFIKTKTMKEYEKQKSLSFPFSNYGASELEGVLSTVGRNWNFDIWFVYNSTGHSIFIVARHLLKK